MMKPTHLQHVAEYVVDMESWIFCQKGNVFQWERELPVLQQTAKDLLTAAHESSDDTEKVFLKTLFRKASNCMDTLRQRIDRRNETTQMGIPFQQLCGFSC